MKKISMVINADDRLGHISPEIYGHFSEHLGRCIYNGIYVGENSPISNTDGIRNDIIEAFSNETVQAVMNEALKYQGWKYVYGGSNPNTSFDCYGLTQWCYGKAGISLPRTAQAQYDATQHIPLSQAQAGDLVFFHSTYNTSDYVTHVGIYVGNNQMYHAGNPIGYTDLTSAYWQQHIICAGRIKQ